MRRSFFLQIDDDWALTADDLQWILNQSRKAKTGIAWRPVAFIASDKLVLAQILERKGVSDPQGPNGVLSKFLDVQPLCFRKWSDTNRRKVSHHG